MVNGSRVQQFGRYYGLDDLLHEVNLELLLGDVLIVLGRYNYGVDADRHARPVLESVLHRHLRTDAFKSLVKYSEGAGN